MGTLIVEMVRMQAANVEYTHITTRRYARPASGIVNDRAMAKRISG